MRTAGEDARRAQIPAAPNAGRLGLRLAQPTRDLVYQFRVAPLGAKPPKTRYNGRVHVAHVKNGRLTLDEPTDLSEGSVVPLEISDDWDDLDDEERAALHESLRESIEQMKAGNTIDIEDALAELRARQ